MKKFSLLAFAILAMIPAMLLAQDSTATNKNLREGFWLRFGIGYGTSDGSFTSGSESLDLVADQGPSGFLALGGALSPVIGIGGTVHTISNSESGQDVLYGLVAPTIVIHPSPTGSFYLQASFGLVVYDESGSIGYGSGNGWGFGVGAGVDIRVSRMLSISPYSNLIYGKTGIDGTSYDIQRKGYFLQFGASLTVH